jgi:stalled ribosome alternative rescue factor ArfA
MKGKKDRTKARVNPQGLMGSACRIEKPQKGKGSFQRRRKHAKHYDY